MTVALTLALTLALDIFTALFVAAGLLFFIAGTVGLLRLPDPLARLHALTKANNAGLGLVVVGLLPQAVAAGGVLDAVKMAGIWLLVQVSSGAVAQVMADVAYRAGQEPQEQEPQKQEPQEREPPGPDGAAPEGEGAP